MSEIKNRQTLQAEINRLKQEVSSKEKIMHEHVNSFRESIKPANLLASFFKNMIGKPDDKQSFIGRNTRKGLLLILEKIFFDKQDKNEDTPPGILDSIFEKAKNFIERKRGKNKERKFYKFDDEYDSESN